MSFTNVHLVLMFMRDIQKLSKYVTENRQALRKQLTTMPSTFPITEMEKVVKEHEQLILFTSMVRNATEETEIPFVASCKASGEFDFLVAEISRTLIQNN